jgi:hypothetical protein
VNHGPWAMVLLLSAEAYPGSEYCTAAGAGGAGVGENHTLSSLKGLVNHTLSSLKGLVSISEPWARVLWLKHQTTAATAGGQCRVRWGMQVFLAGTTNTQQTRQAMSKRVRIFKETWSWVLLWAQHGLLCFFLICSQCRMA